MAQSVSHALLVGAAVFAAGCGGRGTARMADVTPDPPAFRYSPHTAHYIFVSRGSTSQEMLDGTAASTNYEFAIALSASVTADAGHLTALITVDSVPSLTGAASLVAGNVRRAVGKSVSGRLLPTGELEIEAVRDPALGALPQVASLLSEFFPKIPERGLVVGDRWVDTTTTATHSNGIDIVVSANRTYEATRWTSWEGANCLELVAEAVYTLSGEGAMGGQAIILEGRGARLERFFLGEEGAVVGSIVRDSSRADALIAAVGITIPVTQTRSDTLRTIR